MSETYHINRWLGYDQAVAYSGLSTRLLQNLVRDGHVVSSCVRQPGCTRGRRLIERESLDRFIESGIGGKADLAVNAGGAS